MSKVWYFFGDEASTRWQRNRLVESCGNYIHHDADICDQRSMEAIFREYGADIRLVIHTASQPSHDWTAGEPITDFTVNANGTLVLLECTGQFCPQAVFIFTSTNKVYGDRPNTLPLAELEARWEIEPSHPYHEGIDETMSIEEHDPAPGPVGRPSVLPGGHAEIQTDANDFASRLRGK